MQTGNVVSLSWALRPPAWLGVAAACLGVLALAVGVVAVVFPVAYVLRDSPETLRSMMRYATVVGIALGLGGGAGVFSAARSALARRYAVAVRFEDDRIVIGGEEVRHAALARIDYGHPRGVAWGGGAGAEVTSALLRLHAGGRSWELVAIDATAEDLEPFVEAIHARYPAIELAPLPEGIVGL